MKAIFTELDNKAVSVWKWIAQCVFRGMDRDFTRSQIWFQRFWLGLLYFSSVGIWAFFLNFGNFIWGVQDWIWEWRYSRILQEAITSGLLPLHTDPPLSYGVTRYFGIPDVNLAPQMLLLRFLDPGVNFLVNTLLMVSISYLGCLAIRRHFRLSLFSFTILSLLFNFNGFITAHIGIGHTLFTGYFILPFFVLLILQLVEGRGSSVWFAKMGIVLFGIELLGTTQIFAACLLFMCVLFLFGTSIRLQLLKAMVVGVVLNIYRIAPAVIALPSVRAPRFTGFSNLSALIKSLIWIIPPWDSIIKEHRLDWWEFDMYIGLLGLGFIIYFGLFKIWRPEVERQSSGLVHRLMITICVFIMFSIGYLYMPINSIPLPLLRLVHVPSRFFIFPLLFLITLASVRMQAWLDAGTFKSWHYSILSVLFIIFGHDILRHTQLWRVEFVFESFSGGIYEAPLEYNLRIANQVDPLYTNILIISGVVTFISIIYIFYTLRKGSRKINGGDLV
jgi:hypothetical protein